MSLFKSISSTQAEKLIEDSGVVTYEGCSHYAYLERLEQTISVLKSFIGG